MNKLLRTLVGLSIAAIGTLVPISARAVVWKNYANETFCLGNTSGAQLTVGSYLWVKPCNGSTGQSWSEAPYPSGDYDFLYMSAAPAPSAPPPAVWSSRCAYTPSTGNGSPMFLEQCDSSAGSTEAWLPVYSFSDSNGHSCYYFQSLYAAQSGATRVFGVSGGTLANGTHVILWDFLSFHADQYWCAY